MRISDWSSDVCSSDLVRMAPFTLSLDQAGSFRNNRNVPWWLGPRKTPPELSRLHDRLRDAMLRTDTPIERMRFAPHLTIMRADRALPPTPNAPIEWCVDEFVRIRRHIHQKTTSNEIVSRGDLSGETQSNTNT